VFQEELFGGEPVLPMALQSSAGKTEPQIAPISLMFCRNVKLKAPRESAFT